MSFWKIFWIIVVAVSCVLGRLFYNLYLGIWAQYSIAQASLVAQLYIGTATIIGIVVTLLYATYQFARAVARPEIGLYLDESKARKKSIRVTETPRIELPLFVHNEGNAVAELYQIELSAPISLQDLYELCIVPKVEVEKLYFSGLIYLT